MLQRTFQFALPVVILLMGIGGAAMLVSARKTPERKARQNLGPLVEVIEVVSSDVSVKVTGHGEVVPRVSVNVVPQVAGQVVDVHHSLVAGGFFAAGEALIVIDSRDYELMVARAHASVARALVKLEQEEAEAEVARGEWESLNPGEEPASGLVVREPQIRQAQAELESARADLEVAKLSLERTRVSLPFDGVVVSKNVDIGQFATTGAPVATVYGTDIVDVRVPLESRELAWFNVPGKRSGSGTSAKVSASFAGQQSTWSGRVVRMEAELDKASRMVLVIVEVDDPYASSNGRPPLLPGTFADVTIAGTSLPNTVTVPRHAVHEDDTIWVVSDGILEIREVVVARREKSEIFITGGLEDGEWIVVSALDAVTNGMVVRTAATGGGDA